MEIGVLGVMKLMGSGLKNKGLKPPCYPVLAASLIQP